MDERWPSSESELGPPIESWLVERGWDIFHEVRLHPKGGTVCDMVGIKGEQTLALELKRTLTFDVIAQALHWRSRAHLIVIVVPEVGVDKYGKKKRWRDSEGRNLAADVIRWKGLGLFEVNRRTEPYLPDVRFEVKRTVNPLPYPVMSDLRAQLRPEHKEKAKAGSATGGYWTAFKDTCKKLHEAVVKEPGIALSALIEKVPHHYKNNKSARTNLADLLEQKAVPGLRLERDGKRLIVWPAEKNGGDVE